MVHNERSRREVATLLSKLQTQICVSHTMTFIPFKQSGNRLYIDYDLYRSMPELADYINRVNSNRRGTFTIDMVNRRVWFYPPENYVMPSLATSKAVTERS